MKCQQSLSACSKLARARGVISHRCPPHPLKNFAPRMTAAYGSPPFYDTVAPPLRTYLRRSALLVGLDSFTFPQDDQHTGTAFKRHKWLYSTHAGHVYRVYTGVTETECSKQHVTIIRSNSPQSNVIIEAQRRAQRQFGLALNQLCNGKWDVTDITELHILHLTSCLNRGSACQRRLLRPIGVDGFPISAHDTIENKNSLRDQKSHW